MGGGVGVILSHYSFNYEISSGMRNPIKRISIYTKPITPTSSPSLLFIANPPTGLTVRLDPHPL